MKKMYSFLALLLFIATANACMKKSVPPVSGERKQLTVIVMDSTQALLDNVSVRVGKLNLKTSWDGRVLLLPGLFDGKDKLTFSRDGYEKKTVDLAQSIPQDGTLLVHLKRSPCKSSSSETDKMAIKETGVCLSAMSRHAEKDVLMAMPAMPDVVEEVADYAPEEVKIAGYAAATENNVSAGKLTAGEVNDFAKWNLWTGVLDGSHKQYAPEWRMTPRHRYTVQVMTKSGFPVVSRAVTLVDNNGNTIFQALTDNTGKAELWYQLLGNNLCGKHTDFYVRVDDKMVPAKTWEQGANVIMLDEECAHSDDVDVMFVFDATGSMGDELRYLQAEMKDVISRAKEATRGLNIRTGAVVYRDHTDDYLTRLSRLTEDLSVTQSFIDKQQAGGGGDWPEAVPEALMAALNSAGWNSEARARIAFLVLDAPCHGDSAAIALLHEQVLNAAALGVRIVPVVCSGIGDSGELLVRTLALATNGTSFFLTDDSGIGAQHHKPNTDTLAVEHLNDMMVRTIVEFSYIPDCVRLDNDDYQEDGRFVPNPFEAADMEMGEVTIPHGENVLYLVDVTGKLITVMTGSFDDSLFLSLKDRLPAGVYFLKAYYGGQWHTRKLLFD